MTETYRNQDPEKVLKEVWGYDSFRDNQAEAIQDIIEGNSDLLYLARTGAGKALHKDTLIPVYPKGFKTMGELLEGDTVFSREGNPTRVKQKFQPEVDKHYKLTFQNGEVVKACKDHLWVLEDGSVIKTEDLEIPARLVSKEFVKYQHKDSSNCLITKGQWFAKGTIPEVDMYNSRDQVMNLLEGILIELGSYVGGVYIIRSMNPYVTRVLGQILGILGISYRKVSLSDFDTAIIFLHPGTLSKIYKQNLRQYLEYVAEEAEITPIGDTIIQMEEIKDNPRDYYCITVDDPTKTFLITESYIPTHNSLVFQLPSLIRKGLTLVISPLLALQSDQVIAAKAKGIDACLLNSTLGLKQRRETLDGIQEGKYNLCYIAPESLMNMSVLDVLRGQVKTVIVDEAHCFPGDTRVITDKGKLRLDELENYDARALSYDGEVYTYKRIINVFKNPSHKHLLKLTVRGADGLTSFISTDNHEYYTAQGVYKEARELSTEDTLVSPDHTYQVVGYEMISNNYPYLYDIEVEDNHNYLVCSRDTQEPVLVHNCVSQYGHDFRPDYQKAGTVIRATFPGVPIVALTATADEETKKDILSSLKLGSKLPLKVYVQDLDRANIHYHIYERVGNGYKQLLGILGDLPRDEKLIVYCSTKNACDDLSRFLNKQGYKSRPYYSTVSKKDKERYAKEFSAGETTIMCCTSSFGMGIDEEVRAVVVMALPTTLEDTVQYFGRAGRSGQKSHAYLLYDKKKDLQFQRWLVTNSISNPNRKKLILEKIKQVSDFAASDECYRVQILRYFGQQYHKESCGTCSNCIRKIKL